MMRTITILTAVFVLQAIGCSSGRSQMTSAETRQALGDLEEVSHQQWLERNFDALDQLFGEDYLFIAMNGALEPRSQFTQSGASGDGSKNALKVKSLRNELDEFIVDGDTNIVISTLHIDASFGGRQLPYDRMRVMSVYKNDGDRWRLLSRSMTPINQRGPRPSVTRDN